jgi:hypothetical protein
MFSLLVHPGTVLDGEYIPLDSEHVNSPVNGDPLELTVPKGMSY